MWAPVAAAAAAAAACALSRPRRSLAAHAVDHQGHNDGRLRGGRGREAYASVWAGDKLRLGHHRCKAPGVRYSLWLFLPDSNPPIDQLRIASAVPTLPTSKSRDRQQQSVRQSRRHPPDTHQQHVGGLRRELVQGAVDAGEVVDQRGHHCRRRAGKEGGCDATSFRAKR